METKKAAPSMGRLILVLFAICAVCSLLLGLVNMITVEPIAKSTQAKTDAAMEAVLAADSYEEVEYTGGDPIVTAVYKAGDAGWVVQAAPSGFGGTISMVVGVHTDGPVSGVSIIKMSEPSGLGAHAAKDTFRAQFAGKSGTLAVTKDGGEINALTGATITSRAVTSGVNSALEAVKTLG
jgi:electron transport complex protein RnfG